jgi:protein-S-isoprenylcysteine O-methyltransferase Ste14
MLIVAAAATDSKTTYLVGTIVGGIGFGATFFGALRALVARIPAEHRAAVMASVYVVGYASLSVPAILAGVVVTFIPLQSTFEIFGSLVAAIGLAVAFEAWRTRPQKMPHVQAEPADALLDLAA